jgi:Domain of unknown function (DUF1844)
VDENSKKEEVKVEDRRHFDKEGNVVSREEESADSKAAPSGELPPESPEKLDFVSILFTYVHTALIYLGDLPDPSGATVPENLPGAQQMIDILELMQEKTKGNLTPNEGKYLESALFDLRMRYLQKSKIIK